jgi:hypothetical protein
MMNDKKDAITNVYEIENVLNGYELKNAYKKLLSNHWSIGSSFDDDTFNILFPSVRVSYEDTIYQPYWFGYFSGIVSSINSHLRKEKKFDLGSYKIKHINLFAQQHANKHAFHFHDHRQYRHVLVGFLTPDWEDSWGGELQIEDKTIKFKPGNFVLFSGNKLHDAMPVKINLPYWRISVGIFID